MDNIITREKLCFVLSKSRTDKDISQKKMAKALGRSLGTIQNWEYGYSVPDTIEVVEWFRVLGLHPMRYILEMLHPEVYEKIGSCQDERLIDNAINMYMDKIATSREKRQLAFMAFGGTGSSWHSQMNMLCALNHLPIMDRVNIAESILNLYEMRESRGELRCEDDILPDLNELKMAIELCKESVKNGKEEYFVK